MKNKQLVRYMLKMFISYFLAIGIPISILTAFYLSFTLQRQKSEQYTQYESNVKEEANQFKRFIERAVEFTSLISDSAYLRIAQNSSYEKSVYEYSQLLDMMNTFCYNNNFNINCALYIKESGKVLSTQNAIDNLDSFQEDGIIRDFLKNGLSMSQYKVDSCLVIAMMLPKFYYYDNSAVFLFYYNIDQVYDNMNPQQFAIIDQDQGQLFGDKLASDVLDCIHNTLINGADEGSYQSEEIVVWFKKEAYSQTVFARIYSLKTLQIEVTRTVLTAVLVSLGSLIGVCVIAYLFAKYYTRPVEKLSFQIQKMDISKAGNGSNIFDTIATSLDILQEQNNNYKISIERNLDIVKDHAVRDLLWSRIPVGMSIQQYLRDSGMDCAAETLIPVLVKTGTNLFPTRFSRAAQVNILVKNMMQEYFTENEVYIGSSLLGLDQIVFLLNAGGENHRGFFKVETSMSEQVTVLQEKLGLQVKVITGYPVDTPEDLCQEFVRMRRHLYLIDEEKKTVSNLGKPENSDKVFPTYLKTSLLNSVRIGDQEQVGKIIDQMFACDEKDEKKKKNYIFAVIGNVLVHLLESSAIVNPEMLAILDVFTLQASMDEIRELLKNKLVQIANCFESRLIEKEENSYVHNAKDYIKKNLNRDISLDEIAQYAGINTAYFSRIFKSETGLTPLQYMTKLRIERAKDLLLQDEMPIKKISKFVGYNDIRSFIRFFKKLEGCTPNEFRVKGEGGNG